MIRRSQWRVSLLAVTAAVLLVFAGGCRSRSEEVPVQEPAATEVASVEDAPTSTVVAAEQPSTEQPAEETEGEAPTAQTEEETAPVAESQAQGACAHPYYPVRDGAVYRYQMTAPGTEPQEMTLSFSVTGPDSFMTTQVFSGVSTETTWQCTPNGLLRTDFGLGGLNVPGLEYSVDDMSGVTFPLPEQMVEGTAWQNQFSMSGEMSMEGFALTMSIQAITDNVLSGFEEVTTPAGTFNAARVDSTTTLELSTDMAGAPAMPAMNSDTTFWLSEGVGMVKSVSTDPSGGTSTMELVAME